MYTILVCLFPAPSANNTVGDAIFVFDTQLQANNTVGHARLMYDTQLQGEEAVKIFAACSDGKACTTNIRNQNLEAMRLMTPGLKRIDWVKDEKYSRKWSYDCAVVIENITFLASGSAHPWVKVFVFNSTSERSTTYFIQFVGKQEAEAFLLMRLQTEGEKSHKRIKTSYGSTFPTSVWEAPGALAVTHSFTRGSPIVDYKYLFIV